MFGHRLVGVAGAVVLGVSLAACGGGSDTASQTSSSPPASTSGSASSSSAPAAAGPAKVSLAKTGLGTVLTADQGRVLYMFAPDKAGASTCYDQCEANWPPLLTEGAATVDTGLDQKLLGTTSRKDGSTQVTYASWPLYYFTPDTKAGDTKGQGVKGVWWVLTAGGKPLMPATVTVADSGLGKILTDSTGFTLYMFTVDKGGTSACYDKCEAAWPPLLTTEPPKADGGAQASMLGTTKRKDGTTQVTYNKLPLYFFTPDQKPGDTKGQGVKNVWYVMAPDGSVIKSKG
jgi:predicted lipoprotein with Yx(FWY)xxD motif